MNAKMNVSSGVSPESGSDITALFVKCCESRQWVSYNCIVRLLLRVQRAGQL